MRSATKAILVALLVTGLAACGGGGGGSDSPAQTPLKNEWDQMNWDQGQWA